MLCRAKALLGVVLGFYCVGAATFACAMPAGAEGVMSRSDPGTEAPAAAIARAERLFAADALVLGVDRAFLAHSTADAILLENEAVLVRDALDPNAVLDPAAPTLVWFPLWAAISQSGDLGFTTGPVEVGGRRRGHYFTIWKKQADGQWKWVYDGGVGATSQGEPDASTEPEYLAVATTGAGSAAAAMSEVTVSERAFAERANTDSRAAFLSVLADDARLYVAPLPPARTVAAFEQALLAGPARVSFGAPLGGGASAAGDLVWVYGPAEWSHEGGERRGHYVRVWQHRPEGWRVIFAQVVPVRT